MATSVLLNHDRCTALNRNTRRSLSGKHSAIIEVLLKRFPEGKSEVMECDNYKKWKVRNEFTKEMNIIKTGTAEQEGRGGRAPNIFKTIKSK